MIDLWVRIEVPEDAHVAGAALAQARGSALRDQRWRFVAHMVGFVALSFLNCPLYFGQAIVGGLRNSVSSLRGAANYSLGRGLASVTSPLCAMLGICLLARTTIGGVETAPHYIIDQPSPLGQTSQPVQSHPSGAKQDPTQSPSQDQGPQAEPIREEWEQTDMDGDLPGQLPWWLQELLTTLPQRLISELFPESPQHPIQRQIREWLQYQLPNQLQNMVLSISEDPLTKKFPNTSRLPKCVKNKAHFQGILQNLLPSLLYNRLLLLLQGLSPEQLQQFIENSHQEQLQEQLSYLHQDLFRAARLQLVKDMPELIQEEQWQSEWQNEMQNLICKRLKSLHLEPLIRPLQELRQELLRERKEALCSIHSQDSLTSTLFSAKFLKLLEMSTTVPSHLSLRQLRELESHLRPDLVADIILDLFVDQFLEPLQDLNQNGCQHHFLESRLPEMYSTLRHTLFLLVGKSPMSWIGLHHEKILLDLREDIFQSLVSPTTLPSNLEQDQSLAQPIQIGPISVGLTRETWEHPKGYRGMCQLWLQMLLANLPQELISRLPFHDHPPRTHSISPTDQLQERLRALLRHHLPRHLQHMVLSILRDDKTMYTRSYFVYWSIETPKKISLQGLIQNSLSEVLPDWLATFPPELFLSLFQQPPPQQLNEDALQNELQRQIQDRLPNLRQDLLKTVRRKLFKTHPKELRYTDIQDQLHDQIQNQFQDRLRDLHLGQLQNLFRALRQELLDRNIGLTSWFYQSIWTTELFEIRLQQLLQSGDESHQSGQSIFSDLFQGINPKFWMYELRLDLVADLLLDILLDLLKEALPPNFPSDPQEPLLEDQLPHLYQTLIEVLWKGMVCKGIVPRNGGFAVDKDELLKTLRNTLAQSIRPEILPQDQEGFVDKTDGGRGQLEEFVKAWFRETEGWW